MPQMAPINWLMMFFFIITIMMMMSSLMYFNSFYKPKMSMNKKNNKINWKW